MTKALFSTLAVFIVFATLAITQASANLPSSESSLSVDSASTASVVLHRDARIPDVVTGNATESHQQLNRARQLATNAAMEKALDAAQPLFDAGHTTNSVDSGIVSEKLVGGVWVVEAWFQIVTDPPPAS